MVGLLLVLASGAGWLALRSRRLADPAKVASTIAPSPAAKTGDVSAEAFHFLILAKAGQVTAGDIAKQRALLLNGSRESRATLERALRSADPFERLIAFRLLLELDGWSPQLSALALQDSFVLFRVEAADWLYLAGRFQEWDEFLSNAAKNAAADYASLKPAVQHLSWRGLPAGAEMLGAGNGIDRYFREILRRSDSAASLAEGDLLSTAVPAEEQQALLRLLHVANRPDYEALLQNLLARSNEDTPVRYEAIWLIGQAFPTPASRELLTRHLSTIPADPLQSRVERSLASINEQIARGGDRLTWLEAQLAVASKSGSRADYGAALIGLLDEAMRRSRVTDKALLQDAKRVLPAPGDDYAARLRLADIDFLISRNR